MTRSLAGVLVVAALAALLVAPAARATVFTYQAFLDGPSESPPNVSPGTGFAQVLYDDVANTLTISATFSGLLGTTSASHIHATVLDPPSGTTAGVATMTPAFTNFPLGVTSGSMPATVFSLTSSSFYNAPFITANGGTTAGAAAALIAAMNNSPPYAGSLPSRAYFNIHTSVVPGGEIRGFLHLVPEPTTFAMAGMTIFGLVAAAPVAANDLTRRAPSRGGRTAHR